MVYLVNKQSAAKNLNQVGMVGRSRIRSHQTTLGCKSLTYGSNGGNIAKPPCQAYQYNVIYHRKSLR
jgi:hypothetical protein